jgi:ferredoxin
VNENRWLVTVNRRTCIGSGVCASVVPSHFTIVDGGSRPRAEEVDPDDELIDAADLCPMGAITVVERATGKVVAPSAE